MNSYILFSFLQDRYGTKLVKLVLSATLCHVNKGAFFFGHPTEFYQQHVRQLLSGHLILRDGAISHN